jgi:long-chain acyl-CoA synthetase
MDGVSKAVTFTHGETVARSQELLEYITSQGSVNMYKALSFLSLAHISPRQFLFMYFLAGSRIVLTPGAKELITDIQASKPNITLWVPKVFDQLFAGLNEHKPRGFKGIGWGKKLNALAKTNAKIGAKRDISAAQHGAPIDQKFANEVLEILGAKEMVVFSTGQLPDSHLLEFFKNISVDIYDCYGLTDRGGIVAANIPGASKIGTAGKPLPGREVEVREGAVFVDDVRTGDFGNIDDDGYLTIEGREREILILKSGKRILPEPIQQSLDADPIVDNSLIIGERRPWVAVMITLDKKYVAYLLEAEGRDAESIEARILIDKHVHKAVENVNKNLSKEEKIKRYLILEDGFDLQKDFASDSLRLKRDKICKKHKNMINEVLYGK